jgi:hypothetical protein
VHTQRSPSASQFSSSASAEAAPGATSDPMPEKKRRRVQSEGELVRTERPKLSAQISSPFGSGVLLDQHGVPVGAHGRRHGKRHSSVELSNASNSGESSNREQQQLRRSGRIKRKPPQEATQTPSKRPRAELPALHTDADSSQQERGRISDTFMPEEDRSVEDVFEEALQAVKRQKRREDRHVTDQGQTWTNAWRQDRRTDWQKL